MNIQISLDSIKFNTLLQIFAIVSVIVLGNNNERRPLSLNSIEGWLVAREEDKWPHTFHVGMSWWDTQCIAKKHYLHEVLYRYNAKAGKYTRIITDDARKLIDNECVAFMTAEYCNNGTVVVTLSSDSPMILEQERTHQPLWQHRLRLFGDIPQQIIDTGDKNYFKPFQTSMANHDFQRKYLQRGSFDMIFNSCFDFFKEVAEVSGFSLNEEARSYDSVSNGSLGLKRLYRSIMLT